MYVQEAILKSCFVLGRGLNTTKYTILGTYKFTGNTPQLERRAADRRYIKQKI